MNAVLLIGRLALVIRYEKRCTKALYKHASVVALDLANTPAALQAHQVRLSQAGLAPISAPNARIQGTLRPILSHF